MLHLYSIYNFKQNFQFIGREDYLGLGTTEHQQTNLDQEAKRCHCRRVQGILQVIHKGEQEKQIFSIKFILP